MYQPATDMMYALLAIAIAAYTPPAAELCSRCICSGPASFAQRVESAEVVFVGSLLDDGYPSKGVQRGSTFVVDRAWKGVNSDTVVITGRPLPCQPVYLPGGTYLVVADSVGGLIVLPPCDEAIPIQRDDMRLHLLGRPQWIAPLPGKRDLDRLVSLPPARRDSATVESSISLMVRDTQFRPLSGVTVEIVGTGLSSVSRSDGSTSLRALQLGWHRLRLTMPDGDQEDRYIRLFCRQVRSPPGSDWCFTEGIHIIPWSEWANRGYGEFLGVSFTEDASGPREWPPQVDSSGDARARPPLRNCVICGPGKGWAVLDVPQGFYSICLEFETNQRGDWIAHTKKGVVRRMIGKTDISRYLPGSMPPDGSVVRMRVNADKKDSATIVGSISSPLFGEAQFLGKLTADALIANMYSSGSARGAGKFILRSSEHPRSPTNYATLGIRVRQRIEQQKDRHQLLKTARASLALDEFERRMGRAIDDPDVHLAFYALVVQLQPMNLHLYRNPEIAICVDPLTRRPECPLMQAPGDTRTFDTMHLGDGWILTIQS